MPILIRPVREQIEHDRIIRILQARLRKSFDVEVNLGDDHQATLRIGQRVHFPDLVLSPRGVPRKVQGVIEVETGESVNHLEAMAQWAPFGRSKALFQLYVPVANVDITRRLIGDHRITVNELWSYAHTGDLIHFWLVQSSGDPSSPPVGTEIVAPVDAGYVAPPAPAPPPTKPPAPPQRPVPVSAVEAPPPVKVAGKTAQVKGKPAPAAKTAKPIAQPAAKPGAKAAAGTAVRAQAAKPGKLARVARPGQTQEKPKGPRAATGRVSGRKPAPKVAARSAPKKAARKPAARKPVGRAKAPSRAPGRAVKRR